VSKPGAEVTTIPGNDPEDEKAQGLNEPAGAQAPGFLTFCFQV
jgi:hypothetical protein